MWYCELAISNRHPCRALLLPHPQHCAFIPPRSAPLGSALWPALLWRRGTCACTTVAVEAPNKPGKRRALRAGGCWHSSWSPPSPCTAPHRSARARHAGPSPAPTCYVCSMLKAHGRQHQTARTAVQRSMGGCVGRLVAARALASLLALCLLHAAAQAADAGADSGTREAGQWHLSPQHEPLRQVRHKISRCMPPHAAPASPRPSPLPACRPTLGCLRLARFSTPAPRIPTRCCRGGGRGVPDAQRAAGSVRVSPRAGVPTGGLAPGRQCDPPLRLEPSVVQRRPAHRSAVSSLSAPTAFRRAC